MEFQKVPEWIGFDAELNAIKCKDFLLQGRILFC